MSSTQNIAFIGLGMMGEPMAARLASAGYRVFVSDADSERVDTFVEKHRGDRLTASAIPEIDVVVTMLPNSRIVESVLLNDNPKHSLASKLKAGAVVIDMSSSEPARSKALGSQLHDMGLSYLDAPVSGGVKRAIDGTLAILVGGEPDLLERQRALLGTMGKTVLHVGPAGAGHAAKALNNFVSAAGLLATVEALQVGNRFGIDPAVLTDVLNASSGQTNTSINKVKQFMLSGSFASGFSLQLMAKDLRIAAGLANDVDYPMMLGKVCVDVWSDVAEQVSPSTDHTEMYRFLS